MPAMRVPAHGHGRLLTGNPGNKGGGRTPWKLVEKSITVLDLTLDELEVRLNDPAERARLSVDELRLVVQALAAYVLPSRIEHSGPAGGPIPIEQVHNDVAHRLRQRLDARLTLRRPE